MGWWNIDRTRAKSHLRKSLYWVLALFAGAALTTLVFDDLIRAISRFIPQPPTPFIAVVASQKSVDFAIPKEFVRGFESAYKDGKQHIELPAGRRVDIRVLEDLGSADEAKRIADQLVNDPDCVMVIGNSNSTLTDASLDIFLRAENSPTYILPIATAVDLLTKAKTGGHDAVLRMVPDNARQAEVIQRLVKDMSRTRRVVIYGDQENEVYSFGLSRDVASRIRADGGRVLVEEMIGPTNSIYSSLRAWESSTTRPDVIVYVGVAHHGLLLIDQLAELKISVPIIFTDGNMVGELLTNIGKIRNRAFVLSPVGSGAGRTMMPTYEPIGGDAYALAVSIVGNCQDVSRAGIRECVARRNGTDIRGSAGQYRFGPDGNNEGMTYKVYEITGGQLRSTQGY